MSISKTLKQARLDAKLSQEEAAEKAGVSRQTMSNWENGKSYPDIVSVITLSEVYDVALDSLLKGDVALLKHLKESTDAAKSDKKTFTVVIPKKQTVTVIAAAILFLLCPCFVIAMLGGNSYMYVDPVTIFAILIPLLFVLTVTRNFKLFVDGYLTAFFSRKEMPKELCKQAAELFRLLSKTAAMAAAMIVIISLINMGHGMDFSGVGDVWNLFPTNLAMTLIAPFYSLVLIIFVFEPAAYILKHKNT